MAGGMETDACTALLSKLHFGSVSLKRSAQQAVDCTPVKTRPPAEPCSLSFSRLQPTFPDTCEHDPSTDVAGPSTATGVWPWTPASAAASSPLPSAAGAHQTSEATATVSTPSISPSATPSTVHLIQGGSSASASHAIKGGIAEAMDSDATIEISVQLCPMASEQLQRTSPPGTMPGRDVCTSVGDSQCGGHAADEAGTGSSSGMPYMNAPCPVEEAWLCRSNAPAEATLDMEGRVKAGQLHRRYSGSVAAPAPAPPSVLGLLHQSLQAAEAQHAPQPGLEGSPSGSSPDHDSNSNSHCGPWRPPLGTRGAASDGGRAAADLFEPSDLLEDLTFHPRRTCTSLSGNPQRGATGAGASDLGHAVASQPLHLPSEGLGSSGAADRQAWVQGGGGSPTLMRTHSLAEVPLAVSKVRGASPPDWPVSRVLDDPKVRGGTRGRDQRVRGGMSPGSEGCRSSRCSLAGSLHPPLLETACFAAGGEAAQEASSPLTGPEPKGPAGFRGVGAGAWQLVPSAAANSDDTPRREAGPACLDARSAFQGLVAAAAGGWGDAGTAGRCREACEEKEQEEQRGVGGGVEGGRVTCHEASQEQEQEAGEGRGSTAYLDVTLSRGWGDSAHGYKAPRLAGPCECLNLAGRSLPLAPMSPAPLHAAAALTLAGAGATAAGHHEGGADLGQLFHVHSLPSLTGGHSGHGARSAPTAAGHTAGGSTSDGCRDALDCLLNA